MVLPLTRLFSLAVTRFELARVGESMRRPDKEAQDILGCAVVRELKRHAFRSDSRISGNRATPQGSHSREPVGWASAHGLFAESYLMQRRDDPHSQLPRRTGEYKAPGRLPDGYDSSATPQPPIPATLTFRDRVCIRKEALSLLGLSSEPASQRPLSPGSGALTRAKPFRIALSSSDGPAV